ncbi:MAG: ribosomal RNA large subunit methyltransferase I [Porticoccaceae bacterium]|nr:MAG: ribosomal RNA large subunit methyltransferase I [Porticoccaceae bacterium]
MKSIRLAEGREASLLRRHPWIFSGAVAEVQGEPAAGETVAVRAADGRFLAWAAYSPRSQIRARVWTFREAEAVEPPFFHRRLAAALARRRALVDPEARTGYRLVFGEADGLPGVVVDRYGDFLVCQFLSAGAEYWREVLLEGLLALVPCRGIHERSDTAARGKEGLAPRSGTARGEAAPEEVEIVEFGCRFGVDVWRGHKTGFYLDQAENRYRLAALCAGARVLNAFSYTGAFTVAALRAGAEQVVEVDSSASALAASARNLARNGLRGERCQQVRADVFELLRRYRAEGKCFDLVILDPPRFADGRAQLPRAARAYKDLVLNAAPLVAPGGLLVNFSCSAAVDPALFQKITADGFLDADREGRAVAYLTQGPDHPVALSFPESLYLKGLVNRVE